MAKEVFEKGQLAPQILELAPQTFCLLFLFAFRRRPFAYAFRFLRRDIDRFGEFPMRRLWGDLRSELFHLDLIRGFDALDRFLQLGSSRRSAFCDLCFQGGSQFG